MSHPSVSTGVRFTPSFPAPGKARKTVSSAFSDPAANTAFDRSLETPTGVPGDGNCLYWAFGVLLATYGTRDKTQPGATARYTQQHLQPQAIRNKLALRIGDPQHWSSHFLRILEAVRDINPESARAAVKSVTTYLMETLQIPATNYTDMDALNALIKAGLSPADTAERAETLSEPSEVFEKVLKERIDAGAVPQEHMQSMQDIVNTYIKTSLRKNKMFAGSLEVELLAEEFGVVIYYYVGEEKNLLEETSADPFDNIARDFDNARLAHVMFPDEATRRAVTTKADKATDGDVAAREDARLHGFHLVRLGLHFYYGRRKPTHPEGNDVSPTKPWLGPLPGAWWALGLPADTDSAADRAKLLAERRRKMQSAGSAHSAAHAGARGAGMNAELHQAHMASKRRLEQGVLGRDAPTNPNPGYSIATVSSPMTTAISGTAASAIAPPGLPTMAVFPREPLVPLQRRPLAETSTPSQTPAWGSSGARLGSGYTAAEMRGAAAAAITGDAQLDRLLALFERPDTFLPSVGLELLAAGEVHDPRDVDGLEDDTNYNDEDIEMQLAQIEAALQHELSAEADQDGQQPLD